MAILAIFTGQGITKDMYERLRKEVNFERDHPKGAIFHAAGFDAAGNAHVADVWESPEQLNAFVEGRLMPAMKKHNIPAPKVDVHPLHNAVAFPGIERHRAP